MERIEKIRLVAPAPVVPAKPEARTALWIALASGAGLALVGVTALVTGEVEALIYNAGKCDPAGGEDRYQRCGKNRDISNAARTVAAVAFSGAAVAAATSGILLLRAPAPASRQIGCAVAGLGVACSVEF